MKLEQKNYLNSYKMGKKTWSEIEVNLLKKYVKKGLMWEEIITFFPHRTYGSLSRKACHLGIKFPNYKEHYQTIHDSFHSIYGTKNNNIEQLQEFILNFRGVINST